MLSIYTLMYNCYADDRYELQAAMQAACRQSHT
jgi:hypothetical protein